MSEDLKNPLESLEALVTRFKLEPNTVKAFLEELAAQVSKAYLTIEELGRRLSWEERTIRNKMESGIFKKGIHYFSPKGIRPRFKWSAIVAWLEEKEQPVTEQPADAIPMARGYFLGQRRQKKVGVTP